MHTTDISCNFRCTRHSWRWQGWPKRRTWGDRSSRRPWSIRSEGTLRATWTLWPINLFKQNSSCLHVRRKEVCKLQKCLKSQLPDKLLIPSCYQDHDSGLLQKSRCGAVQTSPSETMDSKKRHKGKQRHSTGVEYCTDVSSCDVMIKAAFSAKDRFAGLSVSHTNFKTPTHKHAHTLVINSNKGTALISSFVWTLSVPD